MPNKTLLKVIVKYLKVSIRCKYSSLFLEPSDKDYDPDQLIEWIEMIHKDV